MQQISILPMGDDGGIFEGLFNQWPPELDNIITFRVRLGK